MAILVLSLSKFLLFGFHYFVSGSAEWRKPLTYDRYIYIYIYVYILRRSDDTAVRGSSRDEIILGSIS